MANPRYADGSAVLPAAGGDLGFEPIDAGSLPMACYLDPFAMLWIELALVQGLGRRFALRPPPSAALTVGRGRAGPAVAGGRHPAASLSVPCA